MLNDWLKDPTKEALYISFLPFQGTFSEGCQCWFRNAFINADVLLTLNNPDTVANFTQIN